jgi:hypothetical protein
MKLYWFIIPVLLLGGCDKKVEQDVEQDVGVIATDVASKNVGKIATDIIEDTIQIVEDVKTKKTPVTGSPVTATQSVGTTMSLTPTTHT